MPRRVLAVFVLALLLGLGLVWLFLGDPASFFRGGEHATTATDGETGSRREDDGALRAGGADEPSRGAVLFGRPREQQVGLGGVRGRVAEVEASVGIGGARVLLLGVGYGGEEVKEEVATGDDGNFTIAEIPAGDAFDLRVQAEGLPDRIVPGVTIRNGRFTDLGTLWMGEAVPFEGIVVDSAGLPVMGADVRLHAGHLDWSEMFGQLVELFAELDREPEPLATTLTDRNGRFVFASADPGAVTVLVRATAHPPAWLATVVTPSAEGMRPIRIRLEDAALVQGRVVDAGGRPLAGARIAAMGGNDPTAFIFGRTFTTTEADGRFRLDTARAGGSVQLVIRYPGLPLAFREVQPGTDTVEVVMEGGVVLGVRVVAGAREEGVAGATLLLGVSAEEGGAGQAPQVLGTGVTDASGYAELVLRPGVLQMAMVNHPDRPMGMWSPDTGINLLVGMMEGPADPVLKPGRREITLKFSDAVRVEGVVKDAATGAPIPGARVRSAGGFMMGRPVVSAADGRYAVQVQASGALGLRVEAPGYVTHSGTSGLDRAEVVAGVLRHDVALERGVVVSGRVVDARGKPIAGARLRMDAPQFDGEIIMTADVPDEAIVLSGRSGAFVLDGVPRRDEVRILATRTGYVDGATKAFSTKDVSTVRDRTIVLDDGHVVEVEVVDPSGQRMARAQVQLQPEDGEHVAFDPSAFYMDSTVVTDGDGIARKEAVPSGKLRVTATHPAWAAGETTAVLGPTSASPARVRVTLRASRKVSGRVLAASGEPIAGAHIWVHMEPSTWIDASTDAEGRFDLSNVPAEAAVTLQVQADGYRQRHVEVAPTQTEIEIRLEAEDAEVRRRRDALQARLTELSLRMQSASTDDERKRLEKELEGLWAEMAEVDGGMDGTITEAVEVPVEDEPPEAPDPAR